jgi:hypothetical protein
MSLKTDDLPCKARQVQSSSTYVVQAERLGRLLLKIFFVVFNGLV